MNNPKKIPASQFEHSISLPCNAVIILSGSALPASMSLRKPHFKPTVILAEERCGFYGIFELHKADG